MNNSIQDIDFQETKEWTDSLEAVIESEGVERAHFLLEELIATARQNGANLSARLPSHTSSSQEPAGEVHSRVALRDRTR